MAKTTFPEPVPQPPKRLTIDPPPVIETPTTPVMMNGTVFRDTVYYRQFKSHVDCLVAIQVFVLSLAVGYMILKGIRKLTHHETTRERSQRLLNRRRQRLAAIETMLCLPFRIVWFAVRMTAKLLVFIHITLPWFVIVATGYTTAINIRFTGQFLRYCWRIVVPQGQCARCRNRTFALLYGVSMAITRLAAHAHALGPLGLSLTGSSGPLPAWIITIGQIRTYQDFCVMFFVSAILHIPVRQCLQRLHNCYDPWVQRARRTWREDRTGRVMSSILTLPEDILNAPQAGVQLNETVWLSLFTNALTTWKCVNCAACRCRFRCSSCRQCLQCASCLDDCPGGFTLPPCSACCISRSRRWSVLHVRVLRGIAALMRV
ncbi:uncharacterized protein J3D65DRAFT_643096 [Phyllosticta citribraziliensis]|uniref:Uncharacterized protein n=1 Tax=Phyllosticta citribraziliensis TaxID=989973 RepID=A0ABR1L1L6_9PEZI